MTDIRFDDFDALTFDCYGTLIDWETGLLAAAQPVFAAHGVALGDEELLEAFGHHEARLEAGEYRTYREVLAESLRGMAGEHGVTPTDEQLAGFSESVADWPAFADSAAALARLAGRFRLGVITNCDDDLFARSNERLGVRSIGSSPPSRRAATSPACGRSSSPSRRSTSRARASCTSPRACSTTM